MPDITMVAPVGERPSACVYVATVRIIQMSEASPGSMPVAREIYQKV
jgi:hypothetical protein